MTINELTAGAMELALYELLRQRLVQEVVVAAPGAGAEISVPVPAGETWELLSASYLLTTSVVVANRRSSLRVRDTNNVLVDQVDGAAVQAASLAVPYVFQAGLSAAVAAVVNAQRLPACGIPLKAGYSIGTLTTLIDVADAYSNIVLTVRQWSTSDVERNLNWLVGTLF